MLPIHVVCIIYVRSKCIQASFMRDWGRGYLMQASTTAEYSPKWCKFVGLEVSQQDSYISDTAVFEPCGIDTNKCAAKLSLAVVICPGLDLNYACVSSL